MLPNNATPSKNSPGRRYSLFSGGGDSGGNTQTGASTNPIANILSGITSSQSEVTTSGDNGPRESRKPLKWQGNQTYDSLSSPVGSTMCQRCKRFEVDLTNASDNLSATDTELKASRQVISLLQRQLELFQVEKDGLEKLIVSQSRGHEQNLVAAAAVATSATSSATSHDHSASDEGTASTTDNNDKTIANENNSSQPDEVMQKKLLALIQTQMYVKDEELVKLRTSLKESQNEKEQLKLQLHMLEEDLSKLKEENSLLRENLALRDQTIVSLSNEVFEQGNSGSTQRRQSSADAFGNHYPSTIGALDKTRRHVNKLIETIDAYKKTNELLTTNVIKLTDRCAQTEKREIESRSQCHELEAKCCQIQSKLLSLLKEIEQSSKPSGEGDKVEPNGHDVIRSESVSLLIKRLLEDKSLDIPLSWKEGNSSKRNNAERTKNYKQEYDELGFYILSDTEKEDENYEDGDQDENKCPQTTDTCEQLTSVRPQRHSRSQMKFVATPNHQRPQLDPVTEANEQHEFIDHVEHERVTPKRGGATAPLMSVDSTKNDEANWRISWDDFIKDFDKTDLAKSKEFKTLIRSGVPQEYRCKVWKALVDLRMAPERKSRGVDYYQSLLEPQHRPNAGPGSSTNTLNPSTKQIELDLLRTLPNNKYFETIDSPGTIRLRKVLTAYSAHNPKVGYCQGMNRLAAVALLVLPEEEAFWCLAAIIDKIMPCGYYNDLWLTQVDSNVVMDLVSSKLPNLNDHFKHNGIELSLFAWFLTIFVDGTPPALFLRLWDCFLLEGDKVMFRIALALLKMYENELLRSSSSVSANNFLRSAMNSLTDIDRLFEIAFNWVNPLPARTLRTKRHQNFQVMRAGLRGFGELPDNSKPSEISHQNEDESKNDNEPFEGGGVEIL